MDRHSEGERAHAERVSVYSVATGERMGMSNEDLLTLRYASVLHDIGKVRLDSSLLGKIGALTDEEFAVLRLHAELALNVLEEFEFLTPCIPMIRSHHERWDGKGYPTGLAGQTIPLGGRIIAAAEVLDTMLCGTPWRKALDEDDAIKEIKAESGKQFDPEVVDALLDVQPLIQPVSLDPRGH